MPLILGTNSIKDTGYEVANSLRFNKASSDYLTRTPSGTGNQRTWTFSAWVKRSQIHSAGDQIFQQSHSEGNYMKVYFYANKIYWRGQTSEANSAYLVTNRLFRDVSAWYHIVARFDSTNSTAGDRMRLYINGVEETSFSTDINPSLNYDSYANTTNAIDIGRDNVNATSYLDGYLAEVCYCDGQTLDASSFGEFSEDSPNIWMPKNVSGLTFGNNGYYLDFEDSSALGNDAAGSNNFTVSNITAIDQATDTCTNNFPTGNPLKFSFEDSAVRDPTYSEGNLVALHHESGHKCPAFSTIAANSGKWYCEVKWLAVNGSYPVNQYTGVVNIDANVTRNWNVLGYFYRGDGTQYVVGSGSSFGATYTTNDIIGVFMDLDNNKLYFSKNGAMQNSGDPTSGSTGTGAISLAANTYYAFMTEDYNNGKTSINFGSPEFSISSGNSDPNGYGNFEYASTGYYALNTKNLAEYG
jgi:hypothetical protein